MRHSVHLTESPLDSADTSFDRSEEISTRSETKSFSSISLILERDHEIESLRASSNRFAATILRRSSSHRRLTSPLNEKSNKRKGFQKPSFFGLPVFEVKEEQEKESKLIISKIKIIHDDEEFGINKKSSVRRSNLPRSSERRGRSLDPLRLPKVEEAALQEEDQSKPPLSTLLMKLDVFKDKNEFNLNSVKKTGGFIEKSPVFECSELPIEEELEKEKQRNSDFSSGLFQVSLKVDELDERKRRVSCVGEQENIEIIEEDEKNDQEENRLSKFMSQSRKSIKEEKLFLRKIIKGEIIGEKDLITLSLDKEFVAKGSQMQPLVETEYEILDRTDSESDKDERGRLKFDELRPID